MFFRLSKYRLYILITLICVSIITVFRPAFVSPQRTEVGDELKVNIIEQSQFSCLYKKDYLVFSNEETFINYYSDLTGKKPANAYINPGVNFDYNMAVVISLGEVYKESYEINLNSVLYLGETIEIYFDVKEPDTRLQNTVRRPYLIASVNQDKQIRSTIKLIKFIEEDTGELVKSLPVVQTPRSPFYQIPEKMNVYPVEYGDYGNFKKESYGAFDDHRTFGQAYILLKENESLRVRPPELSFLGNIAIIMNLGEMADGGYKILPNGAYSNAYMSGEDLFIMVHKYEPDEYNIRYYDTTTPYSIASIRVGLGAERINYANFIDEKTGKTLVRTKIR